MDAFYQRTDRIAEKLEFLFKLLLLTNGFLLASSLTYGRKIISFVIWPTALLGCLLVLYRFLFFKRFLKSQGLVFLIIFAVSFAASALYTWRYGYYDNLRYFVFLVFQFGLLYAFDSGRDPARTKKQFRWCAIYYLLVMALLSLLSFIFMAVGYTKTFTPDVGEDIPEYYIGFVSGRLFGAYWDPNIAATMAAAAVLLSVYFLLQKKSALPRVACILNILLQIAYITFSDSRTGRLSLLAGMVLLAALFGARHRFAKARVPQALCVLLLVALTAGITYAAPEAIKDGYNYALTAAATRRQESLTDETDSASDSTGNAEESTDTVIEDLLDRGYDLSTDPSNRRFDIWKSAVEIFKTSPILGVSRGNILAYVDENLPDSYLVTNDYMRFKSMHNLFFEILASQGLLGILPFVAFAVWSVVGVLKNWKYLWRSEEFQLFAIIICVLGTVCASTLVMTEIVYVSSPVSTIFWLGLGCMNHYLEDLRTNAPSAIDSEQPRRGIAKKQEA